MLNRIKIIHQIAVIALIIFFGPIPAYADAGLPMLALALPGMIISLIPIIIIETWHIHRSLGIPVGRALKVMSIANLESTLLGIPFTWFVWVIVEMTLAYIGYFVGQSLHFSLPEAVGILFAVTIGAAWLSPGESTNLYWMIPTASLVLLIPFFYVSWLLERGVAKRFLKEFSREDIYKATFTANLYSYGLLGVLVLGWLTVSLVKEGALNN
jgi:hypothetical protein